MGMHGSLGETAPASDAKPKSNWGWWLAGAAAVGGAVLLVTREGSMANPARNITPESTVYVSSAAWRDNDNFVSVVSTTAKKAKSACHKAMRDAARQAVDDGSYETIRDAMDGIAWYGVHSFKLKDVVSERELDEAMDRLGDSFDYYAETP